MPRPYEYVSDSAASRQAFAPGIRRSGCPDEEDPGDVRSASASLAILCVHTEIQIRRQDALRFLSGQAGATNRGDAHARWMGGGVPSTIAGRSMLRPYSRGRRRRVEPHDSGVAKNLRRAQPITQARMAASCQASAPGVAVLRPYECKTVQRLDHTGGVVAITTDQLANVA